MKTMLMKMGQQAAEDVRTAVNVNNKRLEIEEVK